ncbi:hypothetical protein M413DRAFT_31554 [Hebeloma cylindrosporum]|uniref:Uncharacterized protein n=1 Tax=Hebeloma cylindrosporum TaxID=76867 RepID=A0A0C3BIF4_HEBCY|nr:hypothetical protein M413DRAFT_31554 [Hebeloma cylindrosporum h7]
MFALDSRCRHANGVVSPRRTGRRYLGGAGGWILDPRTSNGTAPSEYLSETESESEPRNYDWKSSLVNPPGLETQDLSSELAALFEDWPYDRRKPATQRECYQPR